MDKKIRIDTDMLLVALEDHSFERQYFLDTETGEILFLNEYLETEDEELQEQIEAEVHRFRRIDPIDSRESFSLMEQFTSTVEDADAAATLRDVLAGKKPFRNFKDTLAQFPAVREQWFSFRGQKLKQLAIEALEDEIRRMEEAGLEVSFLPLPGENSRDFPEDL